MRVPLPKREVALVGNLDGQLPSAHPLPPPLHSVCHDTEGLPAVTMSVKQTERRGSTDHEVASMHVEQHVMEPGTDCACRVRPCAAAS